MTADAKVTMIGMHVQVKLTLISLISFAVYIHNMRKGISIVITMCVELLEVTLRYNI